MPLPTSLAGEVFDNLGRMLGEFKIEAISVDPFPLDVRLLESGMYHLRIDIEGSPPISRRFAVF